ncbi:MAG: hypothetical protein JNN30_16840 [Rhodanobacteraceae bacterium]|nr:hypothetical protein [Rhodanobacteraceae bacterium]
MAMVRPVNFPVLTQHLEEAAFCWLRRQEGLWSPTFRQEHLARADYLLDAHLEGLRVAGTASVDLALSNLQRWKTADEVFVSTYVLLHAGDDGRLKQLEAVMLDDPELIPGAAAALLWAPPDQGLALLQRWWSSRDSMLRRAAVPAALRHPRVKRDTVVLDAIESGDASLRARAFRAVGEWRLEPYREALLQGATDTEPCSRFEANYALCLLGDIQARARLDQDLDHLKGSQRRRGIMAWAILPPSERFAAVFDQRAVETAWHRDLIYALAWRGDPAGLPLLIQWLQVPALARLAAYAICHITGADLDADDLWQQDSPSSEEHEHDHEDNVSHERRDDEEDDEDAGLLPPDTERLTDWLKLHSPLFQPGIRYMAGRPFAMAAEDAASYCMPQVWQAAMLRTLQGEIGAMCETARPRL